ncbi:MAG: hypothetical protein ACLU3F_07035 [Blautia wexlerae]
MNSCQVLRKPTGCIRVIGLVCVYYGESEWDGPFSLKDMLEDPRKIEPLVSDYRMNLVRVRSSGELQFAVIRCKHGV